MDHKTRPIHRYQTKIGQYDKEQWEESVEQRILNGFVQMPLKDTRLKTELIDVDLVRGSSFPKAKPKQSLLTVLRLAILRLLFLPLFARWWVQQTSCKVFAGFLILYLLKMIKWAIFSYGIHHKIPDGGAVVVETVKHFANLLLSIDIVAKYPLINFHSPTVTMHQRYGTPNHLGPQLCAQRNSFADRGHNGDQILPQETRPKCFAKQEEFKGSNPQEATFSVNQFGTR